MAVSDGGGARRPYYPVFLDMRGKCALVVGGGEVACRKAAGLMESGARVTVVAKRPTAQMRAWADDGLVTLAERAYRPGDAAGMLLVYAATDDARANEAVYAEAEAAGALANVVDDPAHCRFIVPSVVRRGLLQLAVSTSGAAPALAKRLRRDLEERCPQDLAAYVELLADVRALVKERADGGEARRAPLLEAACDPALFARFRAGEPLDAEAVLAELFAGAGADADPARGAGADGDAAREAGGFR